MDLAAEATWRRPLGAEPRDTCRLVRRGQGKVAGLGARRGRTELKMDFVAVTAPRECLPSEGRSAVQLVGLSFPVYTVGLDAWLGLLSPGQLFLIMSKQDLGVWMVPSWCLFPRWLGWCSLRELGQGG